MIKRLLIVCYRCLGKIYYFFLPNLIAWSKISCVTVPQCEQKILVTGKGKLAIGSRCYLGYRLGGRNRYGAIEFQARADNASITIGDNVAMNNNVFICAYNKIIIGDHTLIGENVTIMDFEAHGLPPNRRREIGIIGEVTIDRNVWIGNNVTVLKNTNIGENTVIAAGAVVSGTFPANVIIGGVPAKVIGAI
jgi:acetyltransferase-like isoleucine patch superfamily enzyme